MLRVTKRKLSILAGALATALGLTLIMVGVAHAWPNKDVTIEADCDGVTLTGKGFEHDGQMAQSIEWEIDTEPATIGSLTPAVPTTTIALRSGHYTLTWTLIITPEKREAGTPKDFDVPECPGSAAPGATAEADCENEGIQVTLDNTEGSADADFTVTVGDDEKTQTVAAGETADVSFGPLDDGPYTVVVTEVSTKFEKSYDLTVECVDDETPPPTEPTPTPTVQGSTLPHTGAGFPTGAAAAFALLLVSVGGFLLTYRKGLLPLPFMHRH